MSDFIFGPVNSRRFGLSLGVDLSPDRKQCNFDCLYCELKGAKAVEKMQNPPPLKDIVNSLSVALSKFPNIDVITLSANGEPTLYPYLKELINEINLIKNGKKLLILSNSSLMSKPEVRNALLDVDIVKLSLDSIIPKTFQKLNRAQTNIKLEDIIFGIKEFAKIFKNTLILEILVVENFNDTRDDFLALNSVINDILPNRVDVGTIDRPSAYKVNAVSYETLEILSREIKNIPVFIVAQKKAATVLLDFSGEEILQLLKMRPQSEQDVENMFSFESKKRLENLLRDGKIEQISAANASFYKLCDK